MQLKVLSWNIWGGKHLKEVMAFLKTADADTIALQEVIEDKGGNTALTIANELGYECVYALEMHMSSRWTGPPREKEEIIKFGNAILTKHKIVSSKMHELSANEKRVAVQADIQIGDVILRSFSIHLKHDHPQLSNPKALALQNEQADNLVKVLGSEKVIVMGDLNAIPGSYAADRLGSVLQNTEKNSSTPTWCVYREGCTVCLLESVQYKLDYIFASKDIKAHLFTVENSKGSDHLPITATIEI